MKPEQIIASEDKQIRKMGLLPHSYKKIGLGLLLVSVVSWVFIANSAAPSEFLRVLAQNGVLIGLLLLSVSKDKTEDELTVRLRLRSLFFGLGHRRNLCRGATLCQLFCGRAAPAGRSRFFRNERFYRPVVYARRPIGFFPSIKTSAIVQNKIKIERAVMGITQEELAGKIGVSRQTVNSIEKRRYVPSTVLALKIARIFDKNVNELFELEEGD